MHQPARARCPDKVRVQRSQWSMPNIAALLETAFGRAAVSHPLKANGASKHQHPEWAVRRLIKQNHLDVGPFARVCTCSVVHAAPVLGARIVLNFDVVARRRILELPR